MFYCSVINSANSPASGAGNVSEPKLMSLVRRVRVDQCVSAVAVPAYIAEVV